MPTSLVPLPAASALRTPLESGLAALIAGGDALGTALDAVRGRTQARRAVWSSRDEGLWLASAVPAERAPSEFPSDVPTRWLRELGDRGAFKVGTKALARDARARAAGLSEGLIYRGQFGALWLDTTERLRFDFKQDVQQLIAFDWLTSLVAERRRQAASQALAQRGEVAAGVAHDLRNQLSLALFENERLRAHEGLPDKELCAALSRARELCQQFLEAPTDATKAPTTQRLQECLAEEVQGALKLAARRGEVRVLTRNRLESPRHVQEEPFRRIVMNLVLNAIAASPLDGCVRVELRTAKDSSDLELVVCDEGRGMNSAERERLFRAGESRGGSGFGTSSVQVCVRQLRGELAITSSPGQGTRVSVRWPAGA